MHSYTHTHMYISIITHICICTHTLIHVCIYHQVPQGIAALHALYIHLTYTIYTTHAIYTLYTHTIYTHYIHKFLRGKDRAGQSIIGKVSSSYMHENLADVLRNTDHVEVVDWKSFFNMVCVCLITSSLEVKPDNVVVRYIEKETPVMHSTPKPSPKHSSTEKSLSWTSSSRKVPISNTVSHISLVGFDSDSAFTDGIFTNYDGASTHLNALNVLFMLPQMDESVEEDTRAYITSSKSSPEEIITAWLFSMNLQNKWYESLITKNGFTEDELLGLGVPIQLPPEIISRAYENLRTIRRVLRSKDHACTPHKMLEALYPEMSKFYASTRARIAKRDSSVSGGQSVYWAYISAIQERNDARNSSDLASNYLADQPLPGMESSLAKAPTSGRGLSNMLPWSPKMDHPSVVGSPGMNDSYFFRQLPHASANGKQNVSHRFSELSPMRSFIGTSYLFIYTILYTLHTLHTLHTLYFPLP